MCFTVSVEKKAKEAIKNYLVDNPGVKNLIDFEEDQYLVSGFSHPRLPLIKQGVVDMSVWGLIPSFVKKEERAKEMQAMTLNARADTIHEKVSFKSPVKNQRAILPVDGFYEWMHSGKEKIPHYIFPTDGTVFYLGCIYNADTFSIITTNANPLMERIHNTKKRMPLILSREDIQRWVNPTTQRQDVDRLMQPFDVSHMDAYEISKEAGNARINRNHAGIKERVDNINLFKQ